MFFDNEQTIETQVPQRRRTDSRPDLAQLARVERYWRSLIKGAELPSRSDIDPSAIADALGDTMILERVAAGIARVRLAGQRINGLLDMDMRGMPLSVLVSPGSRDVFATKLEEAFANPALVEIPLQLTRGWGRKPIEARLLILPMRDNAGVVARALAVLVTRQTMPAGNTLRFDLPEDGDFRRTLVGAQTGHPAGSVVPTIDRCGPNPLSAMPPAREHKVTRDVRPVRKSKNLTPLRVVDAAAATLAKPAPRPKANTEDKPTHLRLVVSR